jgi:hypothetical protein
MNKTEQPLAIALADELDRFGTVTEHHTCATELRRLHQSEREGWRYSDELEQERKRLTAENEVLRQALRRLIEVSAHLDACQATVGHARAAFARVGEKT